MLRPFGLAVVLFSLCGGRRLHIKFGTEFDSVRPAEVGWQERVRTCETPWTGLKAAADAARNQSRLKVSLGEYIAGQIAERIESEGRVINQGWEGLCSIVAIENILLLENPERFANIIADLYCDGVVGKRRGLSREIRVKKNVLACRKTSKKETIGDDDSSDALYHLEDAVSGKIRAVDWIFAAPLANAAQWSTPCQGKQGQHVESYKQISDWIFPASAVKQKGGEWISLARDLLWKAQHLRKETWNKILQYVRNGGQVILGMSPRAQNSTFKGSSTHAVVLTKVIEASMLSDRCAASIINENENKASCVIWTWAKYFVYEDCDNLRKITTDAVVVLPEDSRRKLGPTLFSRPDVLEQLEHNLKSMWFFRRTGNWRPESLALQQRSFKLSKQQDFVFVPRIDIGNKQKRLAEPRDTHACLAIASHIKSCLTCGLWPGRGIELVYNYHGFEAKVYMFKEFRTDSLARIGNGQAHIGTFRTSDLRTFTELSYGSIVSRRGNVYGPVGDPVDRAPTSLAAVVDFRYEGRDHLFNPLVSVSITASGSNDTEWVPHDSLTLHFQIGDVVSYDGQVCTVTGLATAGSVNLRFAEASEHRVKGSIEAAPLANITRHDRELRRSSCHSRKSIFNYVKCG